MPFSLLHNLPRLSAMLPITEYQKKLIIMSSEIIELWLWDPSPDMIEESKKNGLQNNALNTSRNPKLHHIHHQSRMATTFSTKEPRTIFGTTTMHSSRCNRTTPFVSSDGDGLLLAPRDKELMQLGVADEDIGTGAINLPVPSEPWDNQTIMDTDDSDDIDAIEDVEEKSPTRPTSLDILLWYENVADLESMPEPLPHGSFKRGVIGSQSVNDILMIKGLIDPLVYVQFLDLSVFSRSSL